MILCYDTDLHVLKWILLKRRSRLSLIHPAVTAKQAKYRPPYKFNAAGEETTEWRKSFENLSVHLSSFALLHYITSEHFTYNTFVIILGSIWQANTLYIPIVRGGAKHDLHWFWQNDSSDRNAPGRASVPLNPDPFLFQDFSSVESNETRNRENQWLIDWLM